MFKSLYKETEGFRLVSILTPLCMIGEVVMEMIIPKLMSSIIDAVSYTHLTLPTNSRV